MKLMKGNVKDEHKKHKLMLDILKKHFNEDEEDMLDEENEEEGEENLMHQTKMVDRPYMKQKERMDKDKYNNPDMPPLGSKKEKHKLYEKHLLDHDDEDNEKYLKMTPTDEDDEPEEDDYDDEDDNTRMRAPKQKRKEMIITMLGKKLRKNQRGKDSR